MTKDFLFVLFVLIADFSAIQYKNSLTQRISRFFFYFFYAKMLISQISDESKSEDAKVRDVSVDWNAPTGAYEFELDPDTHELDEAYKEPNRARSFPQEAILRIYY